MIPISSTLVLPDVVTKIKQPSNQNKLLNNIFCAQKTEKNQKTECVLEHHLIAISSKTKHFRETYPRGDCSALLRGRFDTSPDLLVQLEPVLGRFENREFSSPKSTKKQSSKRKFLCESERATPRGRTPGEIVLRVDTDVSSLLPTLQLLHEPLQSPQQPPLQTSSSYSF